MSMTKAELIKENERLRKRVTSLERVAKRRTEESKESQRLRAALTEALEQKTATSEILRVISSSPTGAQPVFDAIVRSARRLMGGRTAMVLRIADDQLHIAALTPTDDAADAAVRSDFPIPVDGAGTPTHVLRTQRPYILADVKTDPLAGEGMRRTAPLRGYRSALLVPRLRESRVIGLIIVTRRVAGGFSGDDIALLEAFADQAVIAIENVRLFTELQQKNEALTQAHAQVSEALEQQTATSEILRVIAR